RASHPPQTFPARPCSRPDSAAASYTLPDCCPPEWARDERALFLKAGVRSQLSGSLFSSQFSGSCWIRHFFQKALLRVLCDSFAHFSVKKPFSTWDHHPGGSRIRNLKPETRNSKLHSLPLRVALR